MGGVGDANALCDHQVTCNSPSCLLHYDSYLEFYISSLSSKIVLGDLPVGVVKEKVVMLRFDRGLSQFRWDHY